MVLNLIVFCVVHSGINRSKNSLVLLRLAMVTWNFHAGPQILATLLQDKQILEEVTMQQEIPSLLSIKKIITCKCGKVKVDKTFVKHILVKTIIVFTLVMRYY